MFWKERKLEGVSVRVSVGVSERECDMTLRLSVSVSVSLTLHPHQVFTLLSFVLFVISCVSTQTANAACAFPPIMSEIVRVVPGP